MADTLAVTPAGGAPPRPGRENPPNRRRPEPLPATREEEGAAGTATGPSPGAGQLDVRI